MPVSTARLRIEMDLPSDIFVERQKALILCLCEIHFYAQQQSPERVYLTNGPLLAPDYVGNRTGAGVDAVAPKLLRHAPFARTLLAARWIHFATRLNRLFDSRKSGAVTRRAFAFCHFGFPDTHKITSSEMGLRPHIIFVGFRSTLAMSL